MSFAGSSDAWRSTLSLTTGLLVVNPAAPNAAEPLGSAPIAMEELSSECSILSAVEDHPSHRIDPTLYPRGFWPWKRTAMELRPRRLATRGSTKSSASSFVGDGSFWSILLPGSDRSAISTADRKSREVNKATNASAGGHFHAFLAVARSIDCRVGNGALVVPVLCPTQARPYWSALPVLFGPLWHGPPRAPLGH